MADHVQAVRYAPTTAKGLEVILWLAETSPGIDVYHLVKAAFYADKHHVSTWGRPIIGDEYLAAPYGPLGTVIYGLIQRTPLDMLALGSNGPLPFAVDGAFRVIPERSPNMRRLSESDVDALRIGLKEVEHKSFDDLVRRTHADPAYYRARGGLMDYRDFIPRDDPRRDDKVAFIEESAPFAVL